MAAIASKLILKPESEKPAARKNLECNRFIVCSNYITDARTGLGTYVNVVDKLELPPGTLGKPVPLQVVADLEGQGDYEVQLFWKLEGKPATDDIAKMRIEKYFRAQQPEVRLPLTTGVHELHIMWRFPGEDGTAWKSAASAKLIISTSGGTPGPKPATGTPQSGTPQK